MLKRISRLTYQLCQRDDYKVEHLNVKTLKKHTNLSRPFVYVPKLHTRDSNQNIADVRKHWENTLSLREQLTDNRWRAMSQTFRRNLINSSCHCLTCV